MTSWAVLLIASVLLVAPGLAFSGLTPECHDQATAHLSDGDELCQGLAPEDPQGDLALQGEEVNPFCDLCQEIMQMLEYMVGNKPSKDMALGGWFQIKPESGKNVIIRATSKVCRKMGLLRRRCNKIMKKFLHRISADIIARKKPQAICVDIMLCKRKAVVAVHSVAFLKASLIYGVVVIKGYERKASLLPLPRTLDIQTSGTEEIAQNLILLKMKANGLYDTDDYSETQKLGPDPGWGSCPSHQLSLPMGQISTGVCGKPSDEGGGQKEEEDPVRSDCQVLSLYKTGLAFSGLSSERHYQATAHLCNGDELCQGLAQEYPQGGLLLQGEELGLLCGPCRKIIKSLEDMVGDQPNEDTIREAASKVCSKMKLLKRPCQSIMKKFLRRITEDIKAGKKPQAICVDIKVCKSKAGFPGSAPPSSNSSIARSTGSLFLASDGNSKRRQLRTNTSPVTPTTLSFQIHSLPTTSPAIPGPPGAAVNENRALAARAAGAGEAAALTDLGNRASV
ncbi:hypothetical protein MJG53_005089 [Ovis ammon polii x Ovis aries]|uniref:Uncharacterized protein n=1 Tax=Ovis ammon polii x Ovis aries TaxID=2918886 RepID=A0ACB9VCA4_9CETA|nr:hypothetical protein MJT46_003121 [Ovis ammon polii x Ovis aries]KAI4587302.1 hypothetical protein MJG53_005089 [Ovis ammon polii x Ovis aries]